MISCLLFFFFKNGQIFLLVSWIYIQCDWRRFSSKLNHDRNALLIFWVLNPWRYVLRYIDDHPWSDHSFDLLHLHAKKPVVCFIDTIHGHVFHVVFPIYKHHVQLFASLMFFKDSILEMLHSYTIILLNCSFQP